MSPSPHRFPPLRPSQQEDLELAASMGSNCFRLSLEWHRLEPARGQWDDAAAQRYKDILACMRRQAAAGACCRCGRAGRAGSLCRRFACQSARSEAHARAVHTAQPRMRCTSCTLRCRHALTPPPNRVVCPRSKGLEPHVTLHHFVHPAWFEKLGGFTKEGELSLPPPAAYRCVGRSCAEEGAAII